VLLGIVPVVPYQTPGTGKLADGVGFATAGAAGNALLLENHGAVTFGVSMEIAWLRMESLDQCCKILLLSKQAGGWRQIAADHREELDALAKDVS
jgi:L-fuculose-phosphate aldolase